MKEWVKKTFLLFIYYMQIGLIIAILVGSFIGMYRLWTH